MFPLRLKLILSLTALSLLLVGGAFIQGGRAEPALTRSNSVLLSRILVLYRRRPLHSLGLLGLASPQPR